ncbi:hypothetical protein EQV77_09580 [Halobacillus fulvus]|nr:hypothetical protein EQV77_09580 [Halobacillus fulvus]
MKMKKNKLAEAISSGVELLSSLKSGNEEQVHQTEQLSIPKDDATFLEVTLDMGIGTFHVAGGSQEWLEGTFTYEQIEPTLAYHKEGERGEIHVSQKSSSTVQGFKKKKNRWDIQLSENVPVDLDINTGVGEAHLDLKSLQLGKVDIDTGVGDVTIDLRGNWTRNVRVELDTGIGNTKILLPSHTGVRLEVNKGIGKLKGNDLILTGESTYTNKAYQQKSEPVIDLELNMGIGNVEIER